jgi:hypothetical protein
LERRRAKSEEAPFVYEFDGVEEKTANREIGVPRKTKGPLAIYVRAAFAFVI